MLFDVPAKTSTVKDEPRFEDYLLSFASELVEFIKARRKYKTYRLGLKYDYFQVGDKIKLKDYGSSQNFGSAETISKARVPFIKLPLRIEGHECYRDKEHQRQVFSGYYNYKNQKIKDDDIFLVIEFVLP